MPIERILIAAGGTGGHIYPALAIAQALRKKEPHCQIYFIGTKHGLENVIVPKTGFPVLHIPVGRLNANVSIFERMSTVVQLPFAFIKSAWLLLRFRPRFVLGVGGHASGPMLLMACLFRFPNAIWEPNAMPGMANRILARFCDECLVVFLEAKNFLKGKKFVQTGIPVREEIERVGLQAKRPHGKLRVFAFGGSQGSRGLNTAVAEMMIGADKAWLETVELVQQTGQAEFARVRELYGTHPPTELLAYVDNMEARYGHADLVIGRSGAGTLAELAACGRPAILVPLASAADNHQQKNAEVFVRAEAAVLLLQKDLNGVSLRETVKLLQRQPDKLLAMGSNAKAFHQSGAAEKIVNHILERVSG